MLWKTLETIDYDMAMAYLLMHRNGCLNIVNICKCYTKGENTETIKSKIIFWKITHKRWLPLLINAKNQEQVNNSREAGKRASNTKFYKKENRRRRGREQTGWCLLACGQALVKKKKNVLTIVLIKYSQIEMLKFNSNYFKRKFSFRRTRPWLRWRSRGAGLQKIVHE